MRDLSSEELQTVSGGVRHFENWWEMLRPLPAAVSPDFFVTGNTAIAVPTMAADQPIQTPIFEGSDSPSFTPPLQVDGLHLIDDEFNRSLSVVNGRVAVLSGEDH